MEDGVIKTPERRGRDALIQAAARGSANHRARCLGILGATAFFAGPVSPKLRSGSTKRSTS
jgi:hypothetical protein